MGDGGLAVLEQIAMYMTALPCPPLPVKVTLTTAEGETKRIGTSSHDLLAGLIVGAMSRANMERNKLRQKKQIELTDRLITALELASAASATSAASSASATSAASAASAASVASVASVAYDACKRFTAEYILAFDDDASGASMQFLDMDDVEKGGKVHRAACSWHAAQDIQHAAPDKRRNAEHFANMTYQELIAEHVARVVSI